MRYINTITITITKRRLSEELDVRTVYEEKLLEIHGVPENSYTSTEEVLLKLGEALNVPIKLEDIEILHKLNARKNPIMLNF